MKKIPLLTIGIVLLFVLVPLFYLLEISKNKEKIEIKESPNKTKVSGAGIAMDVWSFERSYPYESIPIAKFSQAFEANKTMLAQRSFSPPGEWESLGPQNIGGRTLSLAFHPTNENIIYVGAASGGLWRTTTQGVGTLAWEYIETGFPVLGVSAIAIDPDDPNNIIIGTGEVYGSGLAEPGTINRLTRGTYGIGILKSSDGGSSWSQVLAFNENELKGIQDIEIDEQNSNNMFAAATDGLYRSLNGGDTWSLVFSEPNCIDVEIDPINGNIVYVSQGNFNGTLDPNLVGIFKSTNGGNSFSELLDPGLITAWSGNAKLALDPSNPSTIYASIQVGWFNTGTTTPAGIYKSTNAGLNWTLINNQNIAQFQGWYSHDIAINPVNPNEVINVGIDAWKSTDAGTNFVKKSNWQAWPNGQILIDVPQGGPQFVHADIHGVYYHPLVANKVFFVTDGGVFSSEDAGETFVTHNGGLQTGQFYPNLASSATDPNFIITGAQDNNTYIYRGDPSWFKTIGGDGMSAAVNQDDDEIVYGSFQFIAGLQRSTTNGLTFGSISPTLVSGDYSAFLAPYELAPSDQSTMYIGATYLYKSTDGGSNWNNTASQSVDGANVVVNIAISPINANKLIVATSPDVTGGFGTTPKLLKSDNGGQTFTILNGLPNRICKDIEFDPSDSNVVYAVFSGFGTSHIYKSTNGGNNWLPSDSGLPDLPTNTILIDPLNSNDVYVGNDLGVYFSENGGVTWEIFSEELPEAAMIYDLNTSPANRKVRIATHGHGIYQRSFVNDPLSVSDFDAEGNEFLIYPNPASDVVNIQFSASEALRNSEVIIFNMLGQKIATVYQGDLQPGVNKLSWNISGDIKSGTYYVRITSEGKSTTKQLLIE